jgi:hypothetical protein
LPDGTRVAGVVREARAATKSEPGVLDVDFVTMELPSGRSYPITGALTSLDSDSVTRTTTGRLVSKRTSKNDRMKFIGYGAGAGALIGLLTKGNLLRNALLGAAGGYLYSELSKDKARGGYRNVDLKQGAEFGVRLDRQFAYVPVSDRVLGRRDRLDGDDALGSRDRRDDELLGRRDRRDDAVLGRRDRVADPDGGRVGARSPGAIRVRVENRVVSFGAARPMRAGDVVLVPLEPVMSAANLRHFYNPLTREVSVTSNEGTVRATVGGTTATVNGERIRLVEPIRRTEGVLYVPDRFLELATGLRAYWDAASQTLQLSSQAPERSRDRLRDGR